MGNWWAAVPKARWPDDAGWQRRLRDHWAVGWGDRRQELVFIGQNLDEATMRAALDQCLIPGTKAMVFDPGSYRNLPDPFPAWRRADAA